MPRFTLRQMLLAVIPLAVGCSMWQLPKGEWIDLPLAVLSFYFVLSVLRQVAYTRRLLTDQTALPLQQRWGGRILIVQLLAVAATLMTSAVLSYLAATELFFTTPKDSFLDYVVYRTLPRALSVLAMLIAAGLGSWQHALAKLPSRQNIYAVIAAAGTLVAIIAYWADRLVIWFMVYLAMSGMEIAQGTRWLASERNDSNEVLIHRFLVHSLVGVTVVFVNLLVVGSLVKWWNKLRLRWMLLNTLAAGLAVECWLAWWIGARGVRQLSPPFQETIRFPTWSVIIVVATMVSLAVGGFAWRILAQPKPIDRSPLAERPSFLHESWLGSLLLGAVAMAWVTSESVGTISGWLNSSSSADWRVIADSTTFYPVGLFWLATAIGGFGLAWVRWRRRNQRVGDLIPCINPAQFAVIMPSLLVLLVASAPILAAASFSFWLVRY